MESNLPFISDPFFWIFFSAIFSGAGFSKITRFTKREKDPEKSKNRKWILVFLYFSAAIILVVCAVFFPNPSKFLDIRLLYLYGAVTGLFFFIFRFKKAVGLPFTLLLTISIVMSLLFFQALKAFTGETELAVVKVLSVTEEKMQVEIEYAGHPEILELEGQYFAPVVKVIIFDDYLVFLGFKTWYRFVGISSYKKDPENEINIQETRYQFERPEGISETLYEYFTLNEKQIPGIKSVQISVEQKKAQPAAVYSVLLQNDGAIQIVLKE